MPETKPGFLKSTILITFCSVLGIIVNFISQLLIASYFGAKFERDAYFVASTIPVYLSSVFVGSICTIFLPRIVYLIKNDPVSAPEFLSSVFFTLAIITTVIAGLCIIFSNQVISVVASGFNYSQNIYASKILIIIIPTFIFTVLGNLLSSLYQIQHKFLRPALAPIISITISLFFIILLSKRLGIIGLAIGFTAGSIISFLYLVPILKIYKLKIHIDLKNPEFIILIKSSIVLFLSGILFRSTKIFERTIASNLPEGSISYLGYSNQVITILTTLTTAGIGAIIYPALSKLWAEHNIEGFNNLYSKIIRIVLIISIPISLLFIFFGDIFIKIVYERGAFNHDTTIAVSNALAWSMGAFIFLNLGNIVTKVFYISGKTTSISLIAMFELIIYVTTGYYFCKYFSFIGLSMALSLSCMVNVILSIFYINKKIIKLKISETLLDVIKIILISFISIIIVFILYNWINSGNEYYLIICLIPGIFVYYLLGLLFKIDEFRYFKDLLKKRLNFLYYDRRNKT